ncbi:MAG: penicillin-binding protein 2, partial [Pseudomonadota bacterium]
MRRTPRDIDATASRVTRRALFLGGSMAAIVAALGARMRFLGVEQADQFRLLAEENRINIRLLPPARGIIEDRNGTLLASNVPNYRVVITKEDAGDVQTVLNRLSHIIPMSTEDMSDALKNLDRNSPFVPITVADRLPWEEFAKIAVNGPALPGVTPEVGLSRFYP